MYVKISEKIAFLSDILKVADFINGSEEHFKWKDAPKILSKFIKMLKIPSKDIFKDPQDVYPRTSNPEEQVDQDASIGKVPLILSEKGLSAIEGLLHEFPTVYSSGIALQDPKSTSLLNVIGQFLTILGLHVMSMEFHEPGKFEEFKEDLYHIANIWGGWHHMSSRALFDLYKDKSNEDAILDLRKKLEETIKDQELFLKF